MFKHHDGRITVGDFIYPLDEFLIDEPGYPGLPEGMRSRIYDPDNSVSRLFSADSQFDGGDFSALGDSYIAKEATYRAAYAARVAQRAAASAAAAEAAKSPEEKREDALRALFASQEGHTIVGLTKIIVKLAQGAQLTANDSSLVASLKTRIVDPAPDLDSIPPGFRG